MPTLLTSNALFFWITIKQKNRLIYILTIFQKRYVLTSFRFREKGSLIEGYKKVAKG